jgi:hypothetical protein
MFLDWQSVHVGNKQGWVCLLCDDSRIRELKHVGRHENTAMHQTLLEEESTMCEQHVSDHGEVEPGTTPEKLPMFLALVDSGTRNLLESMAGGHASDVMDYVNHPSPPFHATPFEGWGLFEAHEDTELAESLEKQGVARLTKSLLDRFDEMSVGSVDDEDERSDVNEDELLEPTVAGKSLSSVHLSVPALTCL